MELKGCAFYVLLRIRPASVDENISPPLRIRRSAPRASTGSGIIDVRKENRIMPEQLHARVEACYQLAEHFFKRPFPRPDVSLKLRGQKAGVAHLHENRLRFNAKLYQENREHFLQQTVAHEVAHLIAHQLFGDRIQPHGEEWQLVMRGVYELPPDRCHTYAIERRPRTAYLYGCGCPEREFPLTSRRHALIKQGRRYVCRACKQTLTYSGRQGNA